MGGDWRAAPPVDPQRSDEPTLSTLHQTVHNLVAGVWMLMRVVSLIEGALRVRTDPGRRVELVPMPTVHVGGEHASE